jgi:hypothetical protein
MIDENNKLIAEYMGFLATDYGYVIPPNTYEADAPYAEFPISELRYDFDWNALMEVVIDIERNNLSVFLSSNIETTYNNVVNFIKTI